MFNWFRKKKKSGAPRSNREWLRDLEAEGNDAAIEDLRKILIRGLTPALSKYVDRELKAFTEDIVQDALLKILDKLHTFRGESKFTTWALKIAVREGLTELRLKRYEDVSLHSVLAGETDGQSSREIVMQFESTAAGPEQIAHEKMVLEKILHIIEHELSDRQKQAIQCLVVHGIPMTVTAEIMQTNRNALYKVMHDARLKIKQILKEEGIDADSLLGNL